VRPVSAGVAVPVFAVFAAGVTIGGLDGLVAALDDHVALGIVAGLVVGKTVGVFGSTWLMARFTGARLDTDLRWVDVVGLSVLAGVGFTVSLLIGDLAYGAGTARDDHVKVGVLCGSLLAALLAAVVLGLRNRTYRQMHEAGERDAAATPDVDQEPRAPGR
jgi:NhaA family Na+:H+ antiporter